MEDNRQLKKGIIDILLLKLLEQGPMYGYQLISMLDKKSEGVFASKEGTLYPVLYRLEDAGFILSYWERETGKRAIPRKYYALTETGRDRLSAMAEELRNLYKSIRLIMGDDFV